MNRLIQENVSWDLLEEAKTGELDCEITGAELDSKTGKLTMELTLNFVVPARDDRRLKKAVVEQIGVPGVAFVWKYEDMALREDAVIDLYLGRLLAAQDFSVRAAVREEKFDIGPDRVTGSAMGQIPTELLNRGFAKEAMRGLRENFGIEREVVFVNDEEAAAALKKKLDQPDYAPAASFDRWEDDPAGMSMPAMAEAPDDAPFDADQFEGMAPEEEEGTVIPFPEAEAEAARKSASASPRKPRQPRKPKDDRPRAGSCAGDLNVVMGRRINGVSTPLLQVTQDSGEVIVEGILFHKETREIKNKKQLVTLLITDKKISACLKCFMKNEKWEHVDGRLSEGDYIVARGKAEWDRYENCVDIMVRDIEKGTAPVRQDTWEGQKRVELHCHTKMSAMDGLNEPDVIVKTAARWGQPAVAITDHGVVQSFPDAADTAAKLKKKGADIKIIYGMEGYCFEDENWHRDDGTIEYKKMPTNHIILLAATQEGLKNIYKLVSISHLRYFYKRPRLPKSVIQQYREGIIIGSACEAGEVYRAIEAGKSDDEIKKIAEFYDYLEIQPLINNRFLIEKGVYTKEQLRENNKRIVRLADEMGKPVVATTDAHYDEPESAIYRNILQYGMGFKDAENGQGLYLRTTDEMMEEFSYLGEETARRVVIENTNKIADMIDGAIKPTPDEKCPPKIDGAEEELWNECMRRAHEIYGDPLPDVIAKRLDTELHAIIDNGYAVMYVSAQRLVHKSNEDGYLVGSRGSVGSSFAATMAGITEVNPLDPHYICPNCKRLEWGDKQKYDCGIDMPPKKCPECGAEMKRDGFTIPFATFLGFKGNKEPDIDLNFAGEYQPRAHKYVGVIFGEENVFKAGTVGTVAEKTAYGYIRHFFEETGRQTNKFEMDRLIKHCTGVKRTTGQHPGGIIIVPRDHEIYEFCPVQHPANDTKTDIVTTHFDYHKIDKNLLKLDILGHTVPSMIRQLQDMTGVDPMQVDLTDQTVLSIFNGTENLHIKDPDYRYHNGTFAIPEFGTSFTRQMLDDVKPSRFEDLVRMAGFSHGTDVWLGNAQDLIRSGTATMREAISSRDDIMNYLILKGVENETAFRIMEEVRKKNLVLTDDHIELMHQHGVPDWYVDSCRKIKYLFPRAHSVAYVMMSFRMAWYKVYYPQAFYATYFTSVLSNFNADCALRGKDQVLARMDQIQAKGPNATAKEKDEFTVLEVVYEMYARGYEFQPAELGYSKATRFWTKDEKVLLPFAAYSGVGESAAQALVDAYEERPFDTVEDCATRAKLGKGVIDILRQHGVFGDLPETDQISWAI